MSGFVNRHKPAWNELEMLVRKAQRSARRMTPEELTRLDLLYRRTTIHLAQVVTRTNDRRLSRYLNDLTAAAHSVIYVAPRRSLVAGFAQAIGDEFPRCVARHWQVHAISAALLVGGAILAYLAALADPMCAYAIWPQGEVRQLGSTREQLLMVLRHGRDQSGGFKFFFASFLFAHNLKVGILAAALGVLAAIPTAFLMLFNGMILGVFVFIHHQAGIGAEMWAWILPHGVTELGAIVLCGGVGLLLGQAVVTPGWQSRTAALHRAGREVGITLLGVAGMLCVAAVIESYLRQSHLSTGARLTFAGASFAFWGLVVIYGAVRERSVIARRDLATPEND